MRSLHLSSLYSLCLCWITFVSLNLPSQVNGQVQWADHVEAFSSQVSTGVFSAQEILGPPNVLPAYGECGCAWAPENPESKETEFIRVGFAKPERARQILIAENFNPGAITNVYLYDYSNKEYHVWNQQKNASAKAIAGELFSIPIERTKYKVKSVKVELVPGLVFGSNQIDAIGISGKQKAVKLTIDHSFKTYGEVKNLKEVNSKYTEVMPRISPDGYYLYFDRKDHPQNFGGFMNDDIWFSRSQGNGEWGYTQNAGSPLNNRHDNYVCGISNDGTLTLANQYFRSGKTLPGISQSFSFNGKWVLPINMFIERLFTGNIYTEYYISPERDVLLLAIAGVDSEGGKDIYVSFTDDNLNWSRPVNLGKDINTAGTEQAPFLSADRRKIYFSTNGHPGYGSQDIFVAERKGSSWTSWTTPENLGPVVNTEYWDSHFILDSKEDYAYWASNRDEFSGSDIFSVSLRPLPEKPEEPTPEENLVAEVAEAEPEPVKESYPFEKAFMLFGYAQDASNQKFIDASIRISKDDEPDRFVDMSTFNYRYSLELADSVNYQVQVFAEGYDTLLAVFSIDDIGETGVRRKDFVLEPIGYDPPVEEVLSFEKGKVIQLQNVYFDINSAVIQPESYDALNEFLAALQDNPTVNIEIGGHTNDNCEKKFCERLSKSRAKRVMDYFVRKGLDAERVSYKGYGKAAPIADNETAEGRAQNQRVEIKVVE